MDWDELKEKTEYEIGMFPLRPNSNLHVVIHILIQKIKELEEKIKKLDGHSDLK